MKKVLLTVALGFTMAFSCFAQPDVLPAASRFYDANFNMDFESLAELTYPEVVKQSGGKEQFIAKVDADYQNTELRKRLQLSAPVFQIGNVKTIGDRKFCIIAFWNPTRYFYEVPLEADQMKKLVTHWKQTAGTKEVYAEPNRNSINVKRISKLVAISDATTNNQWKFFNFDDVEQTAIFNSLFSSEKVKLGL